MTLVAETAPSKKNPLYNLAENINRLLKIHSSNESDLARSLNITYNTIHRLVNGTTSDPKLSTLQQIADYFNVSLDYLLSDFTPQQSLNTDYYLVPVLTWDNIQSLNFFDTFDKKNWAKWIPVATAERTVINDKCYALESTRSMQPKFPMGTSFIIKPDEPPIDGDCVIIRFREDKSISLRELIIDSPDWQLQSIIPGSKNLILDKEKIEIIGVVVLTLIQTRTN
jgi:transcriptional regulator with XRE-family HTH domain